MKFKQWLEAAITPSQIPNTMSFWHGGNLDIQQDNIAQKSSRIEYGPGLYLATSYEVVAKYHKGSRKLYMVTVEKGVEINDVNIDINVIQQFINTYVIKSKRNQVYLDLQKFVKSNTVNASIFLNTMINNDAVKSNNTPMLRQFLVAQGIDYSIVKHAFGWDGIMLVLFNMNKIVSKQVVTPKDKIVVFDLPTEFA